MKQKSFKIDLVEYQRNIDLGIDPECHECTSHSLTTKGYVKCGRDKFTLAHRWIHWNATGERPEVVMHLCDNKKCLNPSHLKGGTSLDNVIDRDMKGRHVNLMKEEHWNSKLSLWDIAFIRAWKSEGYSSKAISEAFQISKEHVRRIVNNERWKEAVI